MWGPRIALIYFYLISTIAIIMLIIGTYHIGTYIVNSLVYDKYPLYNGNPEDRCAFDNPYAYPKGPYPAEIQPPATSSAEEQKNQQAVCLRGIEAERKQHQVNDLKDAVIFTLIGVTLLGTHFPIALKRSKKD